MKIPMIRGTIDRRMLLNYRVDPDAVARLLPFPFQPKTFNGFGIVGICLIRLKGMRPAWLPATMGVSSENAAHRIAVQWLENGVMREGVYVPRRDTNSAFASFAGGRLFTGEYQRARFDVSETSETLSVSLRSKDGKTSVSVRARVAATFPEDSIFGSLRVASEFFEAGSIGYSATTNSSRHDGVQLRCQRWEMQPLEVDEIRSTFFEDSRQFPPGSVTFDCGLLMRNIEHEWHSLEPLCCQQVVVA